jgi:hypothetical protein
MAKLIRVWDGSAWQEVGTAIPNALTTDGAQTLTNKTISGASNTLTNIGNASLTNSAITVNGSAVSLGGSVTIVTGPASSAVSSNITMAANNRYFVNTSAARTLTLPASPSVGEEIWVVDALGSAATYNITIAPNSNKINGSVQELKVDINNAVAVLLYTGSTYGWKVG